MIEKYIITTFESFENSLQKKYIFSDTPSLKDAFVVSNDLSQKSIENIYKNNSLWKSGYIGVEKLNAGWFKVGLTVDGCPELYCPVTDEAVTLCHPKGGRSGLLVQDFVTNNKR